MKYFCIVLLFISFETYSQGLQDYYGLPKTHYSDNNIIGIFKSKLSDSNSEFEQWKASVGNAFIIYSIKNMWIEDSCGLKEYRLNIVDFLSSYEYLNMFTENDVINIFGKPSAITEKKYKDDSTMNFKTYYYGTFFGAKCDFPYYECMFTFGADSVLHNIRRTKHRIE